MNLEYARDPATDARVYRLEITQGDIVGMKLYPFDRLLLTDCESPDATIADKLLGLELIARRIEESTQKPPAPPHEEDRTG